jgi:hypothetical protein
VGCSTNDRGEEDWEDGRALFIASTSNHPYHYVWIHTYFVALVRTLVAVGFSLVGASLYCMTTSEKTRKHAEKANKAMSNTPCSSIVDRGRLIRLGDVGQPRGIRVASLRSRRGVAVDIDSCLGSK